MQAACSNYEKLRLPLAAAAAIRSCSYLWAAHRLLKLPLALENPLIFGMENSFVFANEKGGMLLVTCGLLLVQCTNTYEPR